MLNPLPQALISAVKVRGTIPLQYTYLIKFTKQSNLKLAWGIQMPHKGDEEFKNLPALSDDVNVVLIQDF